MNQNNEEKARKKKTIALKSVTKDEEDSKELEEGEVDEDMTLITQKFRKFMRKIDKTLEGNFSQRMS